MPINNRVFGSDIPIKVKKTLEARQLVASDSRGPNETMDSRYDDTTNEFGEFIDNSFGGEADLSSRTPFVRMWTAVQTQILDVSGADAGEDVTLYEGDIIKESSEQNPNNGGDGLDGWNYYLNKFTGNSQIENQDELYANEEEEAQAYNDQEAMSFPESRVIWVKDTRNNDYGRWVVRRPSETFSVSNPKVYTIGNNVLNTTDQIKPNDPISTDEYNELNDIGKREYVTNQMFPPEHGVPKDENKFLKPAAGITSLSSNTEGSLGQIKKTTVNFVVHNFADFDEIYNKYFLRPGAQVFVDFGWDTADLYNPNDFFKSDVFVEDMQIELYGDMENGDKKDGYVTKSKGNLEVLSGIVTDYESKITENGSVECSLTITSTNQAMMSFPKLKELKEKIDFLLDNFFQFEALYTFGDKKDVEELRKDKYIPDSNSSYRDQSEYESVVNDLARKTFGGGTFNPSVLSVISGIFLPGDDNQGSQYISLGFLEDKILNAEFGFGKNINDINDTTRRGLDIKIDSSESFTFYVETVVEMQRVTMQAGEPDPPFILPDFWEKSYNTITKHTPQNKDNYPESLLTSDAVSQFDKEFEEWLSKNQEIEEGNEYESSIDTRFHKYDGETPLTTYDKDLKGSGNSGRIPIRELFINAEVIKEAFSEDKTSFRDIINHILRTMNDSNFGIYNFALATGGDNTLKIIDKNYLKITKSQEEQDTIFNNLFKFDVMSPTSIVKNYDVSLSLPNDAIGANLAIQAMSGTNKQALPVSENVIEASSLQEIFQMEIEESGIIPNKDRARVKYLPDLGNFRASSLCSSDTNKINYSVMYKDFTLDADSPFTDISFGSVMNTEDAFSYDDMDEEETAPPEDPEQAKVRRQKIINDNNSTMIRNGYYICDTIHAYFTAKATGQMINDQNPPLPLTLDLTTYGISSLVPGDIFRVDYLPKIYLEQIYFQIIKVTHDVGADGWYTSFNCQFRNKRNKTPKEPILGKYRGYCLSAAVLDKLGIDDSQMYKMDYKGISWLSIFRPVVNQGGIIGNFGYTLLNLATNMLSFGQADAAVLLHPGYRLDDDFAEKTGVKAKLGWIQPEMFQADYAYSFKNKTKFDRLDTGGTVRVMQNFEEALEYMVDLQPISFDEGTFNHIVCVFKFKVSCRKIDGVILASPMYRYNTGTNIGVTAWPDAYNGYGAAHSPTGTAGFYENGDEVFLIINRHDPKRHYAFVPRTKPHGAAEGEYGKYVNLGGANGLGVRFGSKFEEGTEDGTYDFSSIFTKDFKEHFDINTLDPQIVEDGIDYVDELQQ